MKILNGTPGYAAYVRARRLVPFRGAYPAYSGDYGRKSWDKSLEQAGMTGVTAIIIKRGSGIFDRKAAETAAIREAVRHGNDPKNTDKPGGDKWVFLQGKAAYKRWADDFSKPGHKRGLGDAYCMDVYSSCHAQAGTFLRGIAPDYPKASDILTEAADIFDKEAECLKKSIRTVLSRTVFVMFL